MKKRFLSILLAFCMVFSLMPVMAYAEATETEAQTAVEKVQAMIDALPDAESVTEESRATVEAELDAIDETKSELSDEERVELDFTRYDAVIVALNGNDNPEIIDDYYTVSVKTAENLKEAIRVFNEDKGRGTVTVESNITYSEIFDLWNPHYILNLIVDEGVCLTIEGRFWNFGTIIIKGDGKIQLTGETYEHQNDGTIIDEGGILYVDAGNFVNKGIIKSTNSNISIDSGNSVRSKKTISVTAGDNMTVASGNDMQTVWQGDAMTSVVLTADDGYCFPTDYESCVRGMASGISVTRDSEKQITVSGTLANDGDDVNIFLPGIFTITYNLNEGTLSNSNPDVYTSATETFKLNNPTREGYEFLGWSGSCNGIVEDVYITKGSVGNQVYTAQWKDITAPTGEIKIGDNSWKSFLNSITFGLFFKDTQTVTITTEDKGSGVDKVYYYVSENALSEQEVKALEDDKWTLYDENNKPSISPDKNKKCVVYVNAVDKAQNAIYISSDGIVFDAIAPVIRGIEDGKTYCSQQTVTVIEENIATVTFNGMDITKNLDENNQFTLSPTDGKQIIVVIDKAGNEAKMTVTVNNGHQGGTEVRNAKDATCTEDGYTGDTHCKGCGEKLADGKSIAKTGHNYESKVTKEATTTSTGTKTYTCKNCGHSYEEEIAKLPSQSTSPKTGDETPLVATIVVALLSAAALIVLVTYKKRGRYSAK